MVPCARKCDTQNMMLIGLMNISRCNTRPGKNEKRSHTAKTRIRICISFLGYTLFSTCIRLELRLGLL